MAICLKKFKNIAIFLKKLGLMPLLCKYIVFLELVFVVVHSLICKLKIEKHHDFSFTFSVVDFEDKKNFQINESFYVADNWT